MNLLTVIQSKRPVVLFGLLPPRVGDHALRKGIRKLEKLLSNVHVDAVNVPEVRAESSRGIRPVQRLSKIEPRAFASVVETIGVSTVLNRCVVYDEEEVFCSWLKETVATYGQRNLVLVGGETSKTSYPGPSVLRAAELVKRMSDRGLPGLELSVGGIVIPSRRKFILLADEPARMVEKTRHGVDYFISQVLYEAESVKRLLADYCDLSTRFGIEPRRIILSFAPMQNAEDAAFLKWLGVVIPPEVELYLLEDGNKTLERSMAVAESVLVEVLDFVVEQDLEVPLGIDVEQLRWHSFDVAVELLRHLSSKYRSKIYDQLLVEC